ncbi:hypothetical protein BN873_610034 [Candidatus Competibacter denitrificans Run_A_D11]|uniref:Uncharacterized protein n=1 Tax=Candidatus Competibacter denitrificans Run_A_D11 TaxID=1400863 RepID=W6M7M0_9GAMM|nr:hypothetical protein BN873_610034 [Candidatus Competibacter denitrificans Run_A_D11]
MGGGLVAVRVGGAVVAAAIGAAFVVTLSDVVSVISRYQAELEKR